MKRTRKQKHEQIIIFKSYYMRMTVRPLTNTKKTNKKKMNKHFVDETNKK